jgi:hypothetical protein
MVVREGEVVAGVEPAVVGVAEAAEGSDVDHAADLGFSERPSSVSHVTAEAEPGAGIMMPEVVKVDTSMGAHAREGRR